MVIAFRALQGLGAPLIFPVSVSVLTNPFPAERSSQAIGFAYGIAGLGNAAGPLIGGLLTETVGWRAIFWLNVPFTVISLIIGAVTINESSDSTVPRRLDLSGLALIITGIGLFTLTFDRAPKWGWLSAATVVAFIVAVLLLALFVVVERRVRWPLVNMSLARNAKFDVLVIAGTVANIAYVVTIFLSTMYLQQVRGLTPLTARSGVPRSVHWRRAGRLVVGSTGGASGVPRSVHWRRAGRLVVGSTGGASGTRSGHGDRLRRGCAVGGGVRGRPRCACRPAAAGGHRGADDRVGTHR